MKRRILLITAVLFGFISNAQTAGSVAMGAGYANQVYYKLSNGTTNAYPQNSWDVAFLRTSNFGFATRINDAKNLSVFEAGTTADWATLNVSQESTWTQLYNSETEWEVGAFDNGSATYGWGEYNMANHHVTGAVVFVIKYSATSYKKFKIDDFFGGYTFTFATWDGTGWGADTTVTLANANNPTNNFNYYSLETNAPVIAEPASTDWDLNFTKYNTDYPIAGGGSMMYGVTGVLHHPSLEVAENANGTTTGLEFSSDINKIGFDWKTFSGTSYAVDTEKAFFVKYPTGTIYRLKFNTFVGSSTGAITFNYEDVTSLLSTTTFANNASFGVYPNPTTDKKINVVYDLPAGNSDQNIVTVYSLTGAQVFEAKIANNSGFFNQQLDLGSLNSGVYVLKFQSGNYSTTKKIVLN